MHTGSPYRSQGALTPEHKRVSNYMSNPGYQTAHGQGSPAQGYQTSPGQGYQMVQGQGNPGQGQGYQSSPGYQTQQQGQGCEPLTPETYTLHPELQNPEF